MQESTYAELNVGREEVDALVSKERALHERGRDNTLLAIEGAEEVAGEARTSVRHGERGRTSTVLGLDDLITTELNALDVLVELGALEVVAGLGEEGNNGSARVTSNDGDVLGGGVGVLQLGDEARGTDDVEGGNTKEALGVVDALGLEDLGSDGDGGVDLYI